VAKTNAYCEVKPEGYSGMDPNTLGAVVRAANLPVEDTIG